MEARTPWKTGASLALTMAVSYIVCAVLYGLWPEQGIEFLNALFHGLDFGRLVSPTPFTARTAIFPLIVLMVWGFVVGAVFAWVDNWLRSRR